MPLDHTHTQPAANAFTPFVRTLGRGKNSSRSLTREEAHEAMTLIVRGEVAPEQLGAFLMLLRVKEETPEEVAGFCEAVKTTWQDELPTPEKTVDIDWSCYAGKKKQLPWLVLSQLLLSELGYRQCIHGTRGHTPGRLYIEDTYRALGLPVIESRHEIADWDPAQPAFLPLRLLSPQLEEIIQLRHLLGLRSPVHSFSRLLNPFSASTVLQGIFHPGYHAIHQQAAALLGYDTTLVIKGDGGEFERNPDADLRLYWVRQGDILEERLPRQFSERHDKLEALDPLHLRALWRGEAQDEYGEAATLHTATLALMAHNNLSWDEAWLQADKAWQARDRQRLL